MASLLAIRKIKKIGAEKKKTYMCGTTDDTFLLIETATFALMELFQVVMGTMLMVMVPQKCGNDACTAYQVVSQPLSFPGGNLAAAAIALNFTTLILVVLHYWIIYMRELRFIKYLEANAEVAADRLAEVLPYYPDIRAVVRWTNVRSFVSSMILLVFFIINSVLSGIVAFKYRPNDGMTTYTVFFTNILLLVRVLYRSITQSWEGMKIEGMTAMSLFTYVAAVYNVIDSDYVDPRDVSKGGAIDNDDESGHPIPIPDFNKLPMPGPQALRAASGRTRPEEV